MHENNFTSLSAYHLSRSLGECVATSTQSCEFEAHFSIYFEGKDYFRNNERAKAIFEYCGTRLLNECGFKDQSYYGLFLDKEDETNGRQLSSRKYSGTSGGACSGNNCPAGIDFSFPNRRLQVWSPNGAISCNGGELVNCLISYPDFITDDTIEPKGIFNTDTDGVVKYEYLDECDEIPCNPWEEACESRCRNSRQRKAAREFLREVGLQRVVNRETHECRWEGFHCDNNKSITAIFLRRKQVRGRISSEVGELTDLEYIDLAENSIVGTIPREIGNLKKLKSLSLDQNNLTGTLPEELGSLDEGKEEFTIGGNNVSGNMSHYCPQDIDGENCPKRNGGKNNEQRNKTNLRNP